MDAIDYWKDQWEIPTMNSSITCTDYSTNISAKNKPVIGRYYDINGKWLGDAKKNATNIIYVADSVEKDIEGNVIKAKNITSLKVNYTKFQGMAAVVYGESSAAYMNTMTTDLKHEMFAIASVHQLNSIAYGSESVKADEYRRYSLEKNNDDPFKLAANAAVINALLRGDDLSNGAIMWDGKEQALFDKSINKEHVKMGNITIELHMNTMGWTISDVHYNKWKKNIGDEFKAPQEKKAVSGMNKDKMRLKSTAVYCRTIFWEFNEDEE